MIECSSIKLSGSTSGALFSGPFPTVGCQPIDSHWTWGYNFLLSWRYDFLVLGFIPSLKIIPIKF